MSIFFPRITRSLFQQYLAESQQPDFEQKHVLMVESVTQVNKDSIVFATLNDQGETLYHTAQVAPKLEITPLNANETYAAEIGLNINKNSELTVQLFKNFGKDFDVEQYCSAINLGSNYPNLYPTDLNQIPPPKQAQVVNQDQQ